MALPTIGILSTGIYLPIHKIKSLEIAELSGISKRVIEDKFGILEKPIPSSKDHPCYMGARAAKIALKRAKVDPLEIDVILSISAEYKEHPLMLSGVKIQQLIGARNAWALDISQRSCSTISALKIARSLMQTDPKIKTVLLAGGYRDGDLIDYKNPRVSFMYNLAAAGGAILLRRDHPTNVILESALISDADFVDDVYVHAGGTKHPVTIEDLGTNTMMLDVMDVDSMKKRLSERSHANFMKVIRQALEDSKMSTGQIDYLALLHMKRSAHLTTLQDLGLRLDQSYYLERYGHIGQLDPILSIELGVQAGRIKPGALIVMVNAGIGYVWGAQVIRWGS